MNYGKALQDQREYAGLSQSALSKATGIAQPKLSYYESGKHTIPVDDCITLANYYGISIDELIGLSDSPAPERKSGTLPAIPTSAVSFIKEYESLISDNNYITMSKLYKEISPELRALTLGYIVGVLQNNGVNTKKILGY